MNLEEAKARVQELVWISKANPPKPGEVPGISTYLPALSQLMEAVTWQKIETAPKDGTRILVFGTQTYLETKSWVATAEWVDCGSVKGAGYFSTLDQRVMGKISHWMPLPNPPEDK